MWLWWLWWCQRWGWGWQWSSEPQRAGGDDVDHVQDCYDDDLLGDDLQWSSEPQRAGRDGAEMSWEGRGGEPITITIVNQ